MQTPLIVDAHEDLAWNSMVLGRDLAESALEKRRREVASGVPWLKEEGLCMVGLPEWRAGRVAVVFGTLFAGPARRSAPHWGAGAYETQDQANAVALTQMDYYRRVAGENEAVRLIGSRADLEAVLATWGRPSLTPNPSPSEGEGSGWGTGSRVVGIVPLMEGADPIREPAEAGFWFEQGVRLVGLAWTATRYAGGTHEPGPLTPDGAKLLDAMAEVGLMLDLSHAAEEAYYQALDRFDGVTVVTHANPRKFLPTDRGLSDDMIRMLIARDGVMGVVPFNAFMRPGWRETRDKAAVTLDDVVAIVDHVCQLAGDGAHVGIGSDFDGGFGADSVPAEMDTVADLAKVAPALRARGFPEADVTAIMGGNWLRVLRRGLPER